VPLGPSVGVDAQNMGRFRRAKDPVQRHIRSPEALSR